MPLPFEGRGPARVVDFLTKAVYTWIVLKVDGWASKCLLHVNDVAGRMKLTDQGAKTIKDAPGRIEAGVKGFEAMGGKVIGFYGLMGEYDYVAIGEAPSDEVATTFSLALGSGGNVKTTTLRAFTKEEFAGLVKRLP